MTFPTLGWFCWLSIKYQNTQGNKEGNTLTPRNGEACERTNIHPVHCFPQKNAETDFKVRYSHAKLLNLI